MHSAGIVYGYIHGQVFKSQDLRDPLKSYLVACEIAKWHNIPLSANSNDASFNSTLDLWISQIPPNALFGGWTREMFEKEAQILKAALKKVSSPIVFCHNDLQCTIWIGLPIFILYRWKYHLRY